MSTILLSIGSNTFAKTNIDKAKRMLSFLFPDIVFSEPILTEPEDDKYAYLFRNVLAKANTEMSPEEVIDKIKQTERAVGRTPRDKYLGRMIIDIDLIQYDGRILRPQDYERDYVQQLLPTLPEPGVTEISTPAPDTTADFDSLEEEDI
ncbi:2-amino-4-hydroxy-6-hydroxymethyldihydropteridine diphosphokinase [Proteiniphilum sp.]|uniref:2-amino-4-hydroxy-6- hydroxymethyldihydropteridine diphosphokinase n=1 Tax=Proteiniphilum sp. TaxID=1926877 RepID=UPI002B20C1DC|nr:2-amino-4-hydroxy-6-hydroxymethyldihydropteridine diphosphokinase [Proteiniphilum sp.]MEA4917465.1 2-amino-4-hydroxy-6-hydroxymethyldihydropteridine diphosphokinase [Proteiniphilum sp.]